MSISTVAISELNSPSFAWYWKLSVPLKLFVGLYVANDPSTTISDSVVAPRDSFAIITEALISISAECLNVKLQDVTRPYKSPSGQKPKHEEWHI